MTHEERQKLREVALQAQRSVVERSSSLRRSLGSWELQTSNSFRRIGQYGDGDVLCAVKQPSDGHPDLLAPPGVLDYVIAAQPSAVLDLLDQLDAAEALVSKVDDLERRLNLAAAKWREAADTITKLQDLLINEELSS